MIRGKKLVYGVGINDADYPVTKYSLHEGKKVQTWVCPFYKKWRSMLQRCYDPKNINRQPAYISCFVWEGWHTFSSFKSWMEQQDWEGKELDKDLLGDGKLYSPINCCFLSPDLNKFLLDRFAARGEYPIGVSWHKRRNKFQASCKNPLTKSQDYLGLFSCPNEAHLAWKKRKRELALILADQQNDIKIANALRSLFL